MNAEDTRIYLVIILLAMLNKTEKSHVTFEYWQIMYDWRIQRKNSFQFIVRI